MLEVIDNVVEVQVGKRTVWYLNDDACVKPYPKAPHRWLVHLQILTLSPWISSNQGLAMADISNLASIIKEAREVLSTTDGILTSQARNDLATACARLMATIESPVESIFRMMMAVSLLYKLVTGPEVDVFANSLIP